MNGTHGIGNTTHILAAYNTQSCGPRARREATMALSGRSSCLTPPHNDGWVEFLLNQIMPYSMQEIVGADITILNDTAKRSRDHIDLVVEQILPNLGTKHHQTLGLSDITKSNCTEWLLGHTDATYIPSPKTTKSKLQNKLPLNYGTLAFCLDANAEELHGNEHDGFYNITPGTTMQGLRCNRLQPSLGSMKFCFYWHRIAYFRTTASLLAAHTFPMTCLTPRMLDQGTGGWELRGQISKRQGRGKQTFQ